MLVALADAAFSEVTFVVERFDVPKMFMSVTNIDSTFKVVTLLTRKLAEAKNASPDTLRLVTFALAVLSDDTFIL